MINGDTIDQPYSTLIFLPPNGYENRGAIYSSARSAILGISGPDFCEVRLPPGQLVEAAFTIQGDFSLVEDHIPDQSVVLTQIFTDELTGEDAMSGRVQAALLDDDAQEIEGIESVLAGALASDDLLTFSGVRAFAQATLWPPMEDAAQFFADLMSEAIPADHPLPTGLGVLCGYVSGDQLLTFEVWRARGDYVDLMSVSGQSGPHVIEATCLGLSVARELRFMA